MRIVIPLSLVLVLAACSSDPPQRALEDPPASAATAAPSAAASRQPSPSAPSAAPTPSAGSTARAVYWLGSQDRRGPRLYREFVVRPAGTDPVQDAVALMLGGEPRDRDYRSLWADGTRVRAVRREGTTALVDLSAAARTSGGGSAFEAATLQQLVHTVTAADPTVRSVRLLVEGKAVETLWGSADTSRPLKRGPAAEVLGPVWLDVEEGEVLSARFGGTASVFEATVSWQVRQGDRVAQEGFSTADEGAPGRGAWTGVLDVPPGDYELWAYESSAEDGSVTWLDTKRVSVTQ